MTSDANKPQDIGKPPPRWLLKAYTRFNVFVYRITKGKRMNQLEGRPICLITMTGAKTGRRRTIPLMYVPYENALILVASQGGMPKNPVWYYNLVKYPTIIVEHNGHQRELVARQVDAEEKARLWPTCLEFYPDYDLYQQRTDRDIPVFICEPKS